MSDSRPAGLPPCRIAVIDDDPIASLIHREILEGEGHIVRVAEDVDGAVGLVAEFDPALILLDYRMPGGTGADVVRKIRQVGSKAEIIFVSGFGDEMPVRQMLADLNVHGFYAKGSPQMTLLLLVDSALRHHEIVSRLRSQRLLLNRVTAAAQDTGHLQPLPQLLELVLTHLDDLVRTAGGRGPSRAGGALLAFEEAGLPAVWATTEKWAGLTSIETLGKEVVALVEAARTRDAPDWTAGFLSVPLRVEAGDRCCLILEAPEPNNDLQRALTLFAGQCGQAISNNLLFERATVDALTRLSNRGFGLKRLEEVLRLASRHDHTTSVLLLDLDHFKRTNDTYGHAAGDEVLRVTAKTLTETCRTTDVVCRYGGEEFLVVLPSTDANGGAQMAERVLEALRHAVAHHDGEKIRMTASAGVACAVPGDTEVDALLRRADDALYAAKRSGRDQFQMEARLA